MGYKVMDEGISGYRVGEKIGEGGMAIVFKARHLRLDRDVALKVMRDQLKIDTTFAERFLREAKIAAKLSHPNIIQIYDVDEINSNLFLAMELVQGGDLNDRLKKERSKEDALIIFSQLCEALDYAHGEGYIHRDIKPANILFRKNGALALSDFGIARAQHSQTQMTQAGSIIGTPSYMSPEQALGTEVDNRSDLYSLAVMMYEYVTGEKPYQADSTISTVVKHINEPLPVLPKKLQSLQAFFDKALAKQPYERFATGSDLFKHFTLGLKKVKSINNQLDVETTIVTNKKHDAGPPNAYLKANTKASKPRESENFKSLISLLNKVKKASFFILSKIKATKLNIVETWKRNNKVKLASLATIFLLIFLPIFIYNNTSNQTDSSKKNNVEIAESTVQIAGFSNPQSTIDVGILKSENTKKESKVVEGIDLQEFIITNERRESSIEEQPVIDIRDEDTYRNTKKPEIKKQTSNDSCEGLYTLADNSIKIKDFKNAKIKLNKAKLCSKEQDDTVLTEIIDNKLLELVKTEESTTNWKQAGKLATKGDRALEKGHLFLPKNANAWHFYTKALRLRPRHKGGLEGIEKTLLKATRRIARSIEKEKFSQAEKDLNLLSSNAKDHTEIPYLQKSLDIAKNPRSETGKKISKLHSSGVFSIKFKNVEESKNHYEKIRKLAKYHPKAYKLGIKIAVFYLNEARKAEKKKHWKSAEKFISTGLEYHPRNKSLLQLHTKIKPHLKE